MSKWKIYDEVVKSYLTSYPDSTDVQTAKYILKQDKKNVEVDLFRTYIKRNRKRILDQYEGSYEVSDAVNMPSKDVPHYWDKRNPEYSVFVKNPNYVKPLEESETLKEIDFLSIFKDKINPIKIKYSSDSLPYVASGCIFDRAVISDTHIGMDVNKDGYSLYDGLWNEEEIFKSLDVFVNEIFKNQKSDTLLLHDLGDFLDGWDGYTTRGGHKLPQNMDNQKAFDVALKFKISLIDSLLTKYNKIEVVNICNDNHAGAFAYVANSAFKTYIELKYPNNISVINQRKFIDHYIKENKCFILNLF